MPVFLDGQQNLAALTVPGVYGDIILPVPFLLGLPTNIEGLVGVASWGPLNAQVYFSKQADGALFLGPPKIRKYDIMSYVSAATQVGGAIGFCGVRVSDGTDVAATAQIQAGASSATATATFSVQPSASQTITIAGTVVTFVTSGATGLQVNIGPNLVGTVQNLLTFLQGSLDVNLVKATYGPLGGFGILMTAVTPGTAGNSLTLASTVTGIVLSGPTFTGGATGGAPGVTITGKYSGSLGNQIQFSIQNGTQKNTYIAVVAFPGLPPEMFPNILAAIPASGTIAFTQNPANNSTITLNGSAITFVTSGPTGNQVLIGPTLAATLANLIAFTVTTTDPQLIKFTYALGGSLGQSLLLAANINQLVGTAGNALTIATTVTGTNISGGTLTGGTGNGNTFWQNLAATINGGNPYHGPSYFVVATAGAGVAIPIVGASTLLAGGSDGDAGVTDSILMGQDILPRTGMFALRSSNCDGFTLCDMSTIANYAACISFGLSETMLPVFATPSGDTIPSALSVRNNAGIDSPWFWLILGDYPTYYDSYNGLSRLVNPSAFALGIIGNLSPQNSPLNKPLQGISSTQRTQLGWTYSEAELSLINQGGIDVIVGPLTSPGGFYYSFGVARNASSNTAANEIVYTRMTNFLIRTAQSKAAGSFVGRLQSIQPNDQTRRDAKSLFDGLSAQLASPQVGNGINGQGMIDIPWLVQCDLNNNPPNLQALGYLFLYWQVRYLNVVRYFVIKFQGGGNVTVNVQSNPPTPQQFSTPVAP